MSETSEGKFSFKNVIRGIGAIGLGTLLLGAREKVSAGDLDAKARELMRPAGRPTETAPSPTSKPSELPFIIKAEPTAVPPTQENKTASSYTIEKDGNTYFLVDDTWVTPYSDEPTAIVRFYFPRGSGMLPIETTINKLTFSDGTGVKREDIQGKQYPVLYKATNKISTTADSGQVVQYVEEVTVLKQ